MRGIAGFTLIEMAMALGVGSIVMLSITSVLAMTAKFQTTSMEKVQIWVLRQNLVRETLSDTAWKKTTDAGKTGAASSLSKMDCLVNGTPCTTTNAANGPPIQNQLFALYDENGNLVFDATNPANGFTPTGALCNGFSPSGNNLCPYRFDLKWTAVCMVGNCISPLLKVSATLQYSIKDGKPINTTLRSIGELYRAALPVTASANCVPSGALGQDWLTLINAPVGLHNVATSKDGMVIAGAAYDPSLLPGASQDVLWASKDGGITWTRGLVATTQIENGIPASGWGGIAVSNDGSVIVATGFSDLYISTDKGTTWNLKFDKGANHILIGTWMSGDGTRIHVHDEPWVAGNYIGYYFYNSADSGASWQTYDFATNGVIPPNIMPTAFMSVSGDGMKMAYMSQNITCAAPPPACPVPLYLSTDGGVSFTQFVSGRYSGDGVYAWSPVGLFSMQYSYDGTKLFAGLMDFWGGMTSIAYWNGGGFIPEPTSPISNSFPYIFTSITTPLAAVVARPAINFLSGSLNILSPPGGVYVHPPERLEGPLTADGKVLYSTNLSAYASGLPPDGDLIRSPSCQGVNTAVYIGPGAYSFVVPAYTSLTIRVDGGGANVAGDEPGGDSELTGGSLDMIGYGGTTIAGTAVGGVTNLPGGAGNGANDGSPGASGGRAISTFSVGQVSVGSTLTMTVGAGGSQASPGKVTIQWR